jgi:murein DD-endopeptidase MepM/ murein hydrolase activator NlpD
MARSTVEILGGQLGGSIIQNAASEATLQELVKAVNKMNKAASGRAGTIPGTTPSSQSALKSTPAGMVASLAGEVGEQLGNVLGSIGSLAGLIAANNQKLSSYTSVLNDQVIKKLPWVGGALGAAGDVINLTIGTLESWNDSLKSASKSGASFGQDMLRLRNAAATSYLELDDFVDIIKSNSEKLIGFGDTVTQGAEAFARYNNVVKKQGGVAREQLMQMGMSSKDVSEVMIGFMDRVMRGTRVTALQDREFNEMFGSYALQIDRISKLTGLSATQQEQAMAAAEQDTLFQLKMNSLDLEERNRMNQALREYSTLFPKNGAELFKAMFLGVQPAGEGAMILGQMFPDATRELSKLQSAARRTGMTQEIFNNQLEDLNVAVHNGSKRFYEANQNTLGVLSTAEGVNSGLISGLYDIITPISRVGLGADKTEEFFRKRFRDAIEEAKRREGITSFLNSFGIVISEVKNSFIDAILPFLEKLGETLGKYKLGDKFRQMGAYLGEWLVHHAADITKALEYLGSEQGRDYLFTELKYFLKEIAFHAMVAIKRAFYDADKWMAQGIDDEAVANSLAQLMLEKESAIEQTGVDALMRTPMAQIDPASSLGQTIQQMVINPLEGSNYRISSGFGMRTHPITGEQKMHKGLDLATFGQSVPVKAAHSGMLSYVRDDKGGGGNVVKIYDPKNELMTKYMHLSDQGMEQYRHLIGKNVNRGDIIGMTGSTGSSTGKHLHYEMLHRGKHVDPTQYQKFKQGTLGVTGQLFKDFGGESYANLTGTKAVLTPEQMNDMVRGGGAISVAELTQALNSNMNTLISLTRERIGINRAQLSETSRLSGDVFAAI